MIAEEKYQQMVVWENSGVSQRPLEAVVSLIKQRHQQGLCPDPLDPQGLIVETARSSGIYLGAPRD